MCAAAAGWGLQRDAFIWHVGGSERMLRSVRMQIYICCLRRTSHCIAWPCTGSDMICMFFCLRRLHASVSADRGCAATKYRHKTGRLSCLTWSCGREFDLFTMGMTLLSQRIVAGMLTTARLETSCTGQEWRTRIVSRQS